MFPIWNPFLRLVAVVTAGLAVLAFGVKTLLASYRWDLATMAIVLMALNALGAVGPLHWFRNQNPMRVYLISLAIRMLTLAVVTIALVLQTRFTAADAFSFVLTAMVGFVVFTSFEIRHLVKHQDVLLATPAMKPSAS